MRRCGIAHRFPVALLAWLVLVAAWMTWAPFEFVATWRPPVQLLLLPELETVAHFFMLMPFGAIGAAYFRRPGGRWNWRPAAAVAAGGLVLELGQGWVEGRSLSPHDVLVGYLGAVLAMGVTERFLRRGVAVESVSRALAFATILLAWGLMIHGVVVHKHGLRLAGWTAAFDVLAGEEAGGLRPYVGTVEEPRICAGMAFDVCVEPGAPAASRKHLARAALDSQRVRLTARVISQSAEQVGPARIVTFSDGVYLRNITLGQRNRNLILRVRTPRSGPNGTGMEFTLTDALREHEPTRLTATFVRGVVTMRAESAEREEAGTYRPPFHDSLHVIGLARPRPFHPQRGRAGLVGIVVQFLGLGLALGYVVRRRACRLILAPALAVALLWILDAGLGHALGPTAFDYALAATMAALGGWPRQGV